MRSFACEIVCILAAQTAREPLKTKGRQRTNIPSCVRAPDAPKSPASDARCGGAACLAAPLQIARKIPASRRDHCLLIGVKQTQCGHAATSASDPERT